MRHLVLTAALVLATALPGLAGTKEDAERTRAGGAPTPPELVVATPRVDPTTLFIESNLTETLYHEFGHALVDILDIPLYGPEEFAVDMFAVVLINRLNDEKTAQRVARHVAYAYEEDAVDFRESYGYSHVDWDTHGSNMQRYYNLACLFYGANPDMRVDLALDLHLPDDRAVRCEDEFYAANRAWGAALDRISKGAPGQSIRMDWILDRESHLTRFVQNEVDKLNAMFVLPKELVVSVIPCGEVNAFYDSSIREIIICTELEEHLDELAP